MLIIKVKEGENIDRALRRYKKKVRQTDILGQVRKRGYYVKPSERRRVQIKKAAYQQAMRDKYNA